MDDTGIAIGLGPMFVVLPQPVSEHVPIDVVLPGPEVLRYVIVKIDHFS